MTLSNLIINGALKVISVFALEMDCVVSELFPSCSVAKAIMMLLVVSLTFTILTYVLLVSFNQLFPKLIQDLLTGKVFYRDRPDIYRNVRELVESRGCKLEEHKVTTKDSYVLTLFRLIAPNSNNNQGNPVFLCHGIAQNSFHWLINSNEDDLLDNNNETTSNSLAFALAKRGYDVWLGNLRGTRYSQEHIELSSSDASFWDFCADDFINNDVPAMIDKVLQETKSDKLHYVGYSLGSNICLGILSTNNCFASSRFESCVLLSPYTIMSKPPLGNYLAGLVATVLSFLHGNSFPLAFHQRLFSGHLLARLFFPLDALLKGSFSGFDTLKRNDAAKSAEFVAAGIGDISWKLLRQVRQTLTWPNTLYNYGDRLNREVYGSARQPIYDMKKIDFQKIALVCAKSDVVVAEADLSALIEGLLCNVKDLVVRFVEDPGFCHQNFIYGKHAGKLVNSLAIELLRELGNDRIKLEI